MRAGGYRVRGQGVHQVRRDHADRHREPLRRGGGTSVFDATTALHNRCTHFTYRDADGLRYQADINPASPAGRGGRSQTYDATETADSEVVPTEVTFIQVGDAPIGTTQTGPAALAPVRIVPRLPG